MITRRFEGVIDFLSPLQPSSLDVLLAVKDSKVQASLMVYPGAKERGAGHFFVLLSLSLPLDLRWKTPFEVYDKQSQTLLAKGMVLHPFPSSEEIRKPEKRIELLGKLLGEEKDMLLALAKEKGMRGLSEAEILDMTSLRRKSLQIISRDLEEKREIRILSFSPLFLISQESLNFLGQKILATVRHFHKMHPDERGMAIKRLQKKFEVPKKILKIALRQLERAGEIQEMEDIVCSSSFEIRLSPQEEKLLAQLEEMSSRGEFHSLSLKEIEKKLYLSPLRAQKLISLLVEREKIFQVKDGFIIHARWLEELIAKLRKRDKKELTISEFKAITGLSRKYAIPLLELLDKMGVTRRKGPLREVLKM